MLLPTGVSVGYGAQPSNNHCCLRSTSVLGVAKICSGVVMTIKAGTSIKLVSHYKVKKQHFQSHLVKQLYRKITQVQKIKRRKCVYFYIYLIGVYCNEVG